MIVVTGGAGFIGSAVVWRLNREGIDDIVVVDNLGATEKWKNLVNCTYREYLHKDCFIAMVREDRAPFPATAIVHMGACSSTTERNADYLMENNYRYTKILAQWAADRDIPFIYASSAASYGNGDQGFNDDDKLITTLKPTNMYGYSKHLFDCWMLSQNLERTIVGLKFFNVFGPNEYHKGDMRSVVHKAFCQIRREGAVRLFKSYRGDYGDGGQMRDFIYVKDCAEVIWWFLENRRATGIFNVGTGTARTWNDLAAAVFDAMGRKRQIDYSDMPESVRPHYQYFTEAAMDKLRKAGYDKPFYSLEEAVEEYVRRYLSAIDPYLER
ncbi:MAG: ADP-glyceromanno-heptose 6-epimerase [Deltaproteobacteria bacterium]|nr:ADP-glyceromanno-heptose 6-epimerase [Deltaproteobacteria bacterium]